jgi:hypothetical protein
LIASYQSFPPPEGVRGDKRTQAPPVALRHTYYLEGPSNA